MMKRIFLISAIWFFLLASTLPAATLTGECNSMHGLYFPGETIELTFKAGGIKQNDLTFEVRIADEYGNTLSRETHPVKPDSNGNWSVTINANQKKLGMFRVYPRLSDGTTIPAILSRPAGCMTYAVIVDPTKRKQYPQSETFFGLIGSTRDNRYGAYLGTSWALNGILPIGGRTWWQLEPDSPGQLETRQKKGEKIVLENPEPSFPTPGGEVTWHLYGFFDLSYMPQWMRTDAYHKLNREVMGKRKFMNGPFTPAGRKEFIRFCENVAKMRAPLTPRGEVNLYEFAWEPHYPWNWQGTPEDLVERYKTGSEAVRKNDPRAFVIGPDAAGLTPGYLNWFRTVFNEGLSKYIDGVSIHPYPKGYPPENMRMAELLRELKQIIRLHAGKDLPIFATELGFQFPGDVEGDLKQMRGFLRANLILLGEGVRTCYNFIVTVPGVEVDYSMIHNLDPSSPWAAPSSTPRAVCPALSALTWYLEGTRSAGPLDGLTGSQRGYVYERGQRVTLAAWDFNGKPSPAEIPVGKEEITVANHMGNERRIATPGGILKITLTEDPQYILDVSPAIWGSKAFQPLVSEPPSTGMAGSELLLKEKVRADQTPLKGTLTLVAGAELGVPQLSVPIDLAPGQETIREFRFPVPRETISGTYEVRLLLESQEKLVKSVYRQIQIQSPLAIRNIAPTVECGRYALKMELENLSKTDASGRVSIRLKGIPESRLNQSFALKAGECLPLNFVWNRLDWNPLKTAELEITVHRSDGFIVRVSRQVSMMMVPRSNSIAIDGDLKDWAQIPFYPVRGKRFVVASPNAYRGYLDLSAEVAAAWDEKNLYLCFRVFDDVFCQPCTGIRTWEGDCIQLAFARPGLEISANRLAYAQTLKHVEYDFALTEKGEEVYRTISFDPKQFPIGKENTGRYRLSVRQTPSPDHGIETDYEIAVPWETLAVQPEGNARLGWAFTINDRDHPETEPAHCVRLGAFELKQPSRFGVMILTGQPKKGDSRK